MATQNAEPTLQTNYDSYSQDHEYTNDLGLVVLPVCGPTPKHRVIRLHGGMGMRKVKWSAVKQGSPPVIPTASDTDFDTLLTSTVIPSLPVPDQQAGQYTFTVKGVNVYVQTYPRRAGVNTFPTGAFPIPLEPMDTIASEMAAPALSSQANSANTVTDGTFSRLDAVAKVVAEGVFASSPDGTRWPFSFIPAYFSASTIVG